MVATYRRPGVYLTESLLLNAADVASTTTVAAFVGLAPKGPPNTPILVDSWSAYVNTFGGFSLVNHTAVVGSTPTNFKAMSYMPYALYTFFQNGGRFAWIVRAIDSTTPGTPATIPVQGTGDVPDLAFNINAASVGEWGNNLAYRLDVQALDDRGGSGPDVDDAAIFTLRVLQKNANNELEVVESFPNCTTTGDIAGTKRIDYAVNDLALGSRLIRITEIDPSQVQPDETDGGPIYLTNGIDPGIPDSSQLQAATLALAPIEGPIVLNICGYLSDASKVDTNGAFEVWIGAQINPKDQFPEREDVMMINDSAGPREPGDTTQSYLATMKSALMAGSDSYTAAYGPWVLIPHPAQPGAIAAVPPAGAVMGIIARTDSNIGVFRAPAGVIAGIQNAISTSIKFSDSELGDLNNSNINVIRPVIGSGVCVMGARTRKGYGPDRYVSGRRTLIDIKESLRRSTQWAIFENNDERLWTSLRLTAEQILRPIWERGGLRGSSAAEAFYIRCDGTLNTLSVIAAGEVRMEIGVALEYPAEFVLIKITQINTVQSTSEFPQIV
jgi:hypothetical protein